MGMTPTIEALIPARGGSKRVPGKNMKQLAGQPLIFWTIRAAVDSGIFQNIIVSTDSPETKTYCLSKPVSIHNRLPLHAGDNSPDVEWIKDYLGKCSPPPMFFVILRPTSPFRTAATILRAWEAFKHEKYASSLRAVSRVKQHPGKMWTVKGNEMVPLMNYPEINGHCSYNLPTQMLPDIYIQNASLEIGESRNVLFRNTVSGSRVMPFFTHGLEGFDINTHSDFVLAEHVVKEGYVKL